jgi:hypothetical protein
VSPLSTRERKLLEMARRETDPAHWDRFQPITRGPVVALLGMACLGLVVPFYGVWTVVMKSLGRRS